MDVSTSSTLCKSLQSSSHWDSLNIDKSFSVQFLKPYSDELIAKSLPYLNTHLMTKSDEKCRVLDIATGTGLVAFALFDHLVTSEQEFAVKIHIDGVDYASKMIEGANHKLEQLKERNVPYLSDSSCTIEFQVMDGQDLKFASETFTTLYSNMGILFFPDIPKGFSEMERVLKSGGKAYISSWTRNLPIKAAFDLLERQGRDISSLVKPVYSMSEISAVENYGKNAGFSQVKVESVSHSFVASIKEYVEFSVATISSSSIWKSKEEIEEFKNDLLNEFENQSDGSGTIKVDILAHITELRK